MLGNEAVFSNGLALSRSFKHQVINSEGDTQFSRDNFLYQARVLASRDDSYDVTKSMHSAEGDKLKQLFKKELTKMS